ncbi:MAG: hypothetical protein DRP85_03780 [Candidatus Makaraimicrobium thalassicum]|nr:MAG: hypothetical protein DRP85_03780 [Candidatus Omnitrophota bacterium]
MNKYYYLVASLPYLGFGDSPPVDRDMFISECKKWLSPADMETLLAAEMWRFEIAEEEIDLLREWKSFDSGLREELARVRASRKRAGGYKVPERLKEIMGLETPLLMEEKLERFRWDFLEEKGASYHFDVNWLVVYFLKLQILERLGVFDKDKGEGIFYKLCEVNYEQAIGQDNGC